MHSSTTTYQCEICARVFDTYGEAFEHITDDHDIVDREISVDEPTAAEPPTKDDPEVARDG